MPFYEYRCGSCDHRFEKLVKMSTKPSDVPCPECGEFHSQRLLSQFSLGSASFTAACGKKMSSSSGCNAPSGFS